MLVFKAFSTDYWVKFSSTGYLAKKGLACLWVLVQGLVGLMGSDGIFGIRIGDDRWVLI